MQECYRITKGTLISKKTEKVYDIKFGIVFNIEGVYNFDIYLFDSSFQTEYFEKEQNDDHYFLLKGITEKNYQIETEFLFLNWVSSSENSKLRLKCYNYFQLTAPNENRSKTDKEEINIKYIELEGLKLFLKDATHYEKYRNSGKVDDFFNFDLDHYSTSFICNYLDQMTNYYDFIFFKNPENDNLLLEFVYKENNSLTYKSYVKIKNDLIALLSFANGGNVKVRRELFGKFIRRSQDRIDSSKNNIYSFSQIQNHNINEYLSINKRVHGGNDMLHKLLFWCFNKFIEENKKLDLSSAIYHLNETNNIATTEEKYFVLITILEKLSYKYSLLKENKNNNKYLIDPELFDNLKKELISNLEKYKSTITNKTNYNILKNRISSLNTKYSRNTKDRIISLLTYANISFSDEVNNLIDNERNNAVHQGEVGSDSNEIFKNYYKLDHIIRDIILNVIDYKGFRKRIVKYD